MHLMPEPETTENEIINFFMESSNEVSNTFRDLIIDPIIFTLSSVEKRKKYVQYGSEFLGNNAEMLSKEYPTKRVSFPQKYVDNIFELFGFTLAEFKSRLKEILLQVSDKASFHTIILSPTNVIHAISLYYSDMIGNREVRDSARQQLGLCVYNNVFNVYFPKVDPSENVMAYTYLNMNQTWGLIQAENVSNWIGDTLETSFAFFRSRMSLDMSPKVLVDFLNRVRTSFNQNMKLLSGRYYDNLNNGNQIAADVDADTAYFESKNLVKLRNNIVRNIKSGDKLYRSSSSVLYSGTAKLKNVKTEPLYELAQKVEYGDIGNIIDLIFYVFINREGNEIDDINSYKYINRITNFPTAIDRAISGKPVIIPMVKKYHAKDEIVKAYICLIATYIMYRINDAKS